nr:hypothetical protein [Tanacetum cinerariifolium]
MRVKEGRRLRATPLNCGWLTGEEGKKRGRTEAVKVGDDVATKEAVKVGNDVATKEVVKVGDDVAAKEVVSSDKKQKKQGGGTKLKKKVIRKTLKSTEKTLKKG